MIEGVTLSVNVGAVALGEVLLAIASEAGFALEIRGNLGNTRPQAFKEVPIEEGIRRLVGDNRVNLLFRYESAPDGVPRLIEVVARGAGEVPLDVLMKRRMRTDLNRIPPPPPPPPPPAQ